MNEKFFIYKASVLENEIPGLPFVPMMTRRKLSPVAKITFALLNDCFDDNNTDLIFSSQFGEVDRLNLLIEQYQTDNEVSPISFGSSVHNASIGAFSLFKGIKNRYNAVSAGDNSLSSGLLEAICGKRKTLFCYADTLPKYSGAACLLGIEPEAMADAVELTDSVNNYEGCEYERFVRFLKKETNEFRAPLYTIRRIG